VNITWVVASLDFSGGLRSVFQLSEEFMAKGHRVAIVYPHQPKRLSRRNWYGILPIMIECKRRVLERWPNFYSYHHARSRFLTQKFVLSVPQVSNESLPPADVIVATSWHTAEWVSCLDSSRGTKFYYIQHYEAWSGEEQRVRRTWELPLAKIVIASWLKQLGNHEIGVNVHGPILPGVDFHVFFPQRPVERDLNCPRIGMFYSPYRWKGAEDGINAFEYVRREYPFAKLVMYGSRMPPVSLMMKRYLEFHYGPPWEELRRIYNSCDIWMSPSWTEGCQAPPMEAMACGVPVVTTDVGGVPDFSVAGETALWCPPQKPDLLAKGLLSLLDDNTSKSRIANAGYSYIRQFTWERAASAILDLFLRETGGNCL
jgi:glycosyltransferase involved in cell wall biosynthesis